MWRTNTCIFQGSLNVIHPNVFCHLKVICISRSFRYAKQYVYFSLSLNSSTELHSVEPLFVEIYVVPVDSNANLQ